MSNSHPVHAKLTSLPLFAGFREGELARLLELTDPKAHSAGDVLVAQGDESDAMYLLADGEARVLLKSDGTESELSRLRAGDFFGELALLDRLPRSADVIAATDGLTLKITSAVLHSFAAEFPSAGFKLAMAVLAMVASRIRSANKRYRETLGIVSVLASTQTVMQPANLAPRN